MDIITYTRELQRRVKDFNASQPESDIIQTGKTLTYTRESLQQLKLFVITYKFVNNEEEISFFKTEKPILLSQYFYLKNRFAIQLYDSFRDQGSRVKNYNKQLAKLEKYTRKHRSFYEYCLGGNTNLDAFYFTRSGQRNIHIHQEDHFTTTYDKRLARMLSSEMIRNYIGQAMQAPKEKNDSLNNLQWTSSKVALVELVYALHCTGIINNGKANLKDIVSLFENSFQVDLGNYARVFSEIRIRKKGTTNLLDLLKQNLTTYIEDTN